MDPVPDLIDIIIIYLVNSELLISTMAFTCSTVRMRIKGREEVGKMEVSFTYCLYPNARSVTSLS